jgi:hypothetical protein
MRDTMFELPSRKDVIKCLVNKEAVTDGRAPALLTAWAMAPPMGKYVPEVPPVAMETKDLAAKAIPVDAKMAATACTRVSSCFRFMLKILL